MLFISPRQTDISRAAMRSSYRESEDKVLAHLLPQAELTSSANHRVSEEALRLVSAIRSARTANTGIQDLLNEYALSTKEGVVLMCLAEALLRVPDDITADRLIRDKLLDGNWSSHLGNKDSLFVNASAWGLLLSGKIIGFNQEGVEPDVGLLKKVVGRLGEPVIRAAMKQAMRIMGTQFVLGRDIEEAIANARKQESKGYRYSYDMLGEAARTMADADAYELDYRRAIAAIRQASQGSNPIDSAGISIKLSALHPRYEFAQSQRVMSELLPRVKSLALLAKQANIGFTIDAEESQRLELSLDLIEQLFSDSDLAGWDGFGMAVQAYQKRALAVVEWVLELCRHHRKTMMVRLVKGAYWDTEIKLSQLDGLADYPVFTRKASTDVCYQACARLLLANRDLVYPQFATHNAYSVAAVMELAGDSGGFEFQRLHGMGEELYDLLLKEYQIPCRIYAPVGEHENLLAYLVRRLLENGANTSFVNNIVDDQVPIAELIQDPVAKVKSWVQKANPQIPLPGDIYGAERRNSRGLDLTEVQALIEVKDGVESWCKTNIRHDKDASGEAFRWAINPANNDEILGRLVVTKTENFATMLESASLAFQEWSARTVAARASCLYRLADMLEQERDELIALCIKEAGKTLKDSISEIREAVDFCRYYAQQAQQIASAHGNGLIPRGVVLCISPWNFPLAIFLGQVSAAIAAGNAVIAKPAEQTGLIAQRTLELMQRCGFPTKLVQLVHCPGRVVGEILIPDPCIQAVMFTGSTATGTWIARVLAKRAGEPIPLIAETGGQNCMLVDSTALPEQVVADVIASGFQSAGQRCSALRVLFLQEEIADKIIAMLIGAMRELKVGDPAWLNTDVGPVIDKKALTALNSHVEYLQEKAKLLYACELNEECTRGTYFAPRLYEIEHIDVLKEEVFGPVVHVIRYRAEALEEVFSATNSTGFGLTFGLHSRIQATANKAVARVKAGNIYVNRNMVGAVVGVQPFGGHGLSGTGPKAGGPDYLYRLMRTTGLAVPTEAEVPWSNSVFEQTGTIDKLLEQLEQGYAHWRYQPVVARAALLRAAIEAGFDENKQANWMHQYQLLADEVCRFQQEPMTLVGPTGELNQLIHEPRGLLLSLDLRSHTEQEDELNRQVLTALLAGNTVLHLCREGGFSVQQQAKLNSKGSLLIQQPWTLDELSLRRLILAKQITGVLIQGSPEQSHCIYQMLCQRENGLLPLITEMAEPLLLRRLMLEKVVSTNTTASGGNPSLLALNED